MALIIALFRIVLVLVALGEIKNLIGMLTIWFRGQAFDQLLPPIWQLIDNVAFLGVLFVMWLLPRTFLKLSVESTKPLNIKTGQTISSLQLIEFAIFLIGLFFFLSVLAYSSHLAMSILFHDWDSEKIRFIIALLYLALMFPIMYYHRRIAKFFFRG